MTGKGPASNEARRSSSAVRCEAVAIPPRFAIAVPAGRSVLLELELFVDDSLEDVVRLRAADHPAVDEERWCAVDPRFLAGAEVRVHLRLRLVPVDARV